MGKNRGSSEVLFCFKSSRCFFKETWLERKSIRGKTSTATTWKRRRKYFFFISSFLQTKSGDLIDGHSLKKMKSILFFHRFQTCTCTHTLTHMHAHTHARPDTRVHPSTRTHPQTRTKYKHKHILVPNALGFDEVIFFQLKNKSKANYTIRNQPKLT